MPKRITLEPQWLWQALVVMAEGGIHLHHHHLARAHTWADQWRGLVATGRHLSEPVNQVPSQGAGGGGEESERGCERSDGGAAMGCARAPDGPPCPDGLQMVVQLATRLLQMEILLPITPRH